MLRARQIIFTNDSEALEKSKLKIKESFIANKQLTDEESIKEQITCANETCEFLLQGVVQGTLDTQGTHYKVKITEHTKLHDNVPLKEDNKIDLNKFEIPERFKSK